MNYTISKSQPQKGGNYFEYLVKKFGREKELIQTCIFEAWDEAVPLKNATSYKMLKDTCLIVKTNSSVAKSELTHSKASILLTVKELLKGNKLLSDAGIDTENLITSIVLR